MPPSSCAKMYLPSGLKRRFVTSGRRGEASVCLNNRPGTTSGCEFALNRKTSDFHLSKFESGSFVLCSTQADGKPENALSASRRRRCSGLVPPKKSDTQFPVL